MDSQQNCVAILRGDFRQGVFPPYGGIGYATPAYPRLGA